MVKLSPFLPKIDAFCVRRSGTRPYEGFVDHSIIILIIMHVHAALSCYIIYIIYILFDSFAIMQRAAAACYIACMRA